MKQDRQAAAGTELLLLPLLCVGLALYRHSLTSHWYRLRLRRWNLQWAKGSSRIPLLKLLLPLLVDCFILIVSTFLFLDKQEVEEEEEGRAQPKREDSCGSSDALTWCIRRQRVRMGHVSTVVR
jgi:hypothetical protein